VVSRESLARVGGETPKPLVSPATAGFDMVRYLAKHSFAVIRQKPWGARPGGQIFELSHCPFNKDHVQGSAAFTLVDGKPGFRCQHDGCRRKTIKHVFAQYPADRDTRQDGTDGNTDAFGNRSGPTQSQLPIELAAKAELFHIPEGQAFASIPVAGHREIWLIKSRGFRHRHFLQERLL